MYKTILVPLDLSDTRTARQTLDEALTLLAPQGSLHLLRVVPGIQNAWVGSFFPEEAFVQARQQADEELKQFAMQAFANATCDYKTHTVEGKPADEILAAASALKADLIVIPSHKRSGIEKLVLGSVATKVAGRASMPVLVVKAK